MTHSHNQTLLAKLGFQDKDRLHSDHDLACQYLTTDEGAAALWRLLCVDGVDLRRFLPETDATIYYNRGRCRPYYDQNGKLVDVNGAYCAEQFEDNSPVSAERAYSAAEVCISKGEGKYKTTVGFLDAFVVLTHTRARLTYETTGERTVFATLKRSSTSTSPSGWEIDQPEHKENAGLYRPAISDRRASLKFGNYSREYFHVETSAETTKLNLCVEVKAAPVSANEVCKQLNLYREYDPSREREANQTVWVLAVLWPLAPFHKTWLKTQNIVAVDIREPFGSWRQTEGL